MTPPEQSSRRLASLVKKLRAAAPEPAPADETEVIPGAEGGVQRVIQSLLLWEASSAQARQGLRRLREGFVDVNELRVSMADEIASVLGEKYPLVAERAARLRLVLQDVYRRHCAMTLAPLAQLGKREARAVLEGFEGMPVYAAARVSLLEFGGHGVPCDERLRALLAREGVLDEATGVEAASSWLERQVRAEDSLETHRVLQAWSDEEGAAPRRDRRPAPTSSTATAAPAKRPKRRAPSKTKGRGEPAARRAGGKTRSGG
ncbi:MAG: hypothetical protein SFY69_11355 [Planctomycetota bacterium]|nr:hypothetical protein [Planctomycetota bacterium]